MDPRPFLREHVAGRPMIVGGVLALALGLTAGSYLTAGELFPDRPAPQLMVRGEGALEPVYYMTDASGRIPDYVIGTDRTAPPTDALPPEPIVWEEPAPSEIVADTWTAPAEAAPARVATQATPPSLGGDILLVGEPAPQADMQAAQPTG